MHFRLKTIPFERRYSAKQVHNVIKNSFKNVKLENFTYLEPERDGNHLVTGRKQEMTGDDVVSRKCLYLCQIESADVVVVSVSKNAVRFDYACSLTKIIGAHAERPRKFP